MAAVAEHAEQALKAHHHEIVVSEHATIRAMNGRLTTLDSCARGLANAPGRIAAVLGDAPLRLAYGLLLTTAGGESANTVFLLHALRDLGGRGWQAREVQRGIQGLWSSFERARAHMVTGRA